jgi:hypothetical protein
MKLLPLTCHIDLDDTVFIRNQMQLKTPFYNTLVYLHITK